MDLSSSRVKVRWFCKASDARHTRARARGVVSLRCEVHGEEWRDSVWQLNSGDSHMKNNEVGANLNECPVL